MCVQTPCPLSGSSVAILLSTCSVSICQPQKLTSVPSKESDQTGHRLILVSDGPTYEYHFVIFVMLWFIYEIGKM